MSADERNKDSLLFSLDSLASAEPTAGEGGRDYASGLIDLGALESAGLVDEGGENIAAPVFSAASAIQVAAPRRINPMIVVGAVIAALGLMAGGVFFGMKYMEKDQAGPGVVVASTPGAAGASAAGSVASGAPATTASVPGSVAASTPGSSAASAAGSVAASAPGSTTASKPRVAKAKPRPHRRRPKTTARPKPTQKKIITVAKTTQVASKPPAAPATKAPRSEVDIMLNGGGSKNGPGLDAVDPLLPPKLSKRQIIKVVRRNAGAVRKCKEMEPKTGGLVMVSILIKPSGSVQSAKVTSAQKGTAMGNCVERKVKVFRFEQFSGPPMRIKMPFAL